MKQKYQMVYLTGLLLVLGVGLGVCLLELLELESRLLFLLGLGLCWHGVASMLSQMQELFGERHTLSYQRVYGGICFVWGCAWASLSVLPAGLIPLGTFFTLAMALGAIFAVWMLEKKEKEQKK